MTDFYALTLGILVVWRLTHLLAHEDGPFDVIAKLREYAGESYFGRALDCFYCLSLWISLPLALVLERGLVEQIMFWLACSGGAILLERMSGSAANHTVRKPLQPGAVLTPIYWEDEEESRAG